MNLFTPYSFSHFQCKYIPMEICLCDGGEEGGGHKGGVCDKFCDFIVVKILCRYCDQIVVKIINIVTRFLSKL